MSSQHAVHRTGENNAGDHGDGRHLRRSAGFAIAARDGWGVPGAFARRQVKREKAAPGFWIGHEGAVIAQSFVEKIDVGKRGVDQTIIRGMTPLDAAEDAALADPRRPQQAPLGVGVNCVDLTGLLAED